MALHLTIAKVDETLYSGDATSVTCPGVDGELTILPKHEPLVTKLKPGTVRAIDTDGAEYTFDTDTGVLEVSGNTATVLL